MFPGSEEENPVSVPWKGPEQSPAPQPRHTNSSICFFDVTFGPLTKAMNKS